MRLLLLLSALLAALSGAGGNARTPQTQSVAVAQRVAAAPTVRADAHVLPAAARFFAGAIFAVVPHATPSLPAPRLWMDRRRE